jgi:large subunit ribosomal protein L15
VTSSDAKKYGVKILGDGELKHALTVKLPISKSARAKVEKAGGTCE